MRININLGYDKLHLKEIVILIPKYHTNMVSFLTPILGLYGINVKEFINEFELKTKFIGFDAIIPTSVKISKIKTFEISLKTPYIIPLLSSSEDFSINRPNVNILSIYKISLIKSVFSSNFLQTYHKSIYVSIRKYISLVVKGFFDVKVSARDLDLSNLSKSKFFLGFFKNSILKIISLKKLLCNSFGVFMVFNNASAHSINNLKKQLSVYGMFLDKIQPKLVYNLFGSSSYLQGSIFSISSPYFNSFSVFYKEVYTKTFHSNFFPIYWRFNSNLVTKSFFKEIYVNFFDTINFSRFYILKIIFFKISKILKVVNRLNKTLLFLLKYNYANLSSNIT